MPEILYVAIDKVGHQLLLGISYTYRCKFYTLLLKLVFSSLTIIHNASIYSGLFNSPTLLISLLPRDQDQNTLSTNYVCLFPQNISKMLCSSAAHFYLNFNFFSGVHLSWYSLVHCCYERGPINFCNLVKEF